MMKVIIIVAYVLYIHRVHRLYIYILENIIPFILFKQWCGVVSKNQIEKESGRENMIQSLIIK